MSGLTIVEHNKRHKHVLGMPSKQVMQELASGKIEMLFVYAVHESIFRVNLAVLTQTLNFPRKYAMQCRTSITSLPLDNKSPTYYKDASVIIQMRIDTISDQCSDMWYPPEGLGRGLGTGFVQL